MADGVSVVLYDDEGVATTYENVDDLSLRTPSGTREVFTYGQLHAVTPVIPVDFSTGDQTVYAGDGLLVREAILKRPEELKPENIIKPVNIAGVIGEFEIVDEAEIVLDFSDGNQEAIPYDDLRGVKKVVILQPENFKPENIALGVTIAGVEGTFKGGNGVHKDIGPNFSEGDYTVVPDDDNTLFSSVTVLKPDNLVPQNILNGVDIAGVVGEFNAPKLNAPTVALTSSTLYNNVVVTNPSTNGSFADTINVYANGELALTQAAPAAGSSVTIADASMFVEDGTHTFSAELAGEGFVTSDRSSDVSSTLYEVRITPESVADNYDYPAIRPGATLDIDIYEKASKPFLPLDITVLMNGEPRAYTWKFDDGISYAEDGTVAMCTRNKTGQLTISNVTGSLDIDIPVTDKPQLEKPTISAANGLATITPSNFAEAIHIFVDGEEYAVKQGVTYTVGGSFTTDLGFSSMGVNLGAYVSWEDAITSGDYTVGKVVFNAPESTAVKIKCVLYTSGLSTSNYLVFSKLDTDLSTTTTDSSSAIYATIRNSNSIQYVTYTVPAGEHYIYVKWRVGTTQSDYDAYPGFVPQTLCNNASVMLPDYDEHTITAYVTANGSIDSAMSDAFVYQMSPTVSVTDRMLTVKGVATTAERVDVYIDDTFVGSIENNGSGTCTDDLYVYGYNATDKTVYAKVVLNGVEYVTNSVTADLTIPAISVSMSIFSLNVSNVYRHATAIEVYVNDELVHTIEPTGSASYSVDLSSYATGTGKHSIYVIERSPHADITSETIEAYLTAQPVYGVSGLYSSTVALTRTDDAVGMTYTINSDGTIVSDFDNVFPWCDAKLVTDSYGNKFVQMPEMYFRVTYDSSYRITAVAVSASPQSSGTWYKVDPFCYGRYGTSMASRQNESGTSLTCAYSIPGKVRTTGYTRSGFRTYSSNNGSNYHQLDLYHHSVMLFLWWIEWATKNSQNVMTGVISGSGTTGGSTYMQTGGTDAITTPSGYELTRRQMRWHYIEDFVGNYVNFIDGIYAYRYGSSYYHYVTSDPSLFKYCESSTSYLRKLAYSCPPSSYTCIAAYGWDPNNPFLCMPRTTVSNSSYNTYFCDYYRYSSTTYPVLCVGAPYNGSSTQYGLHYTYFVGSTSSISGVTNSRLLYAGTLE